MRSGEGYVPDWKDTEAYQPLLAADRSFFAWEWLRRNPCYRREADLALQRSGEAGQGSAPEHWGLHAFEDPRLTTSDARPVWRSDVHPYVLAVRAAVSDSEDFFDLERLAAISRLVVAADAREHLLISDGLRAIRIDVLEGSLRDGRVGLHYLLSGFASTEGPLLTLRRLLALWRTGRFSAALHPGEARARRFVLMLRTYDALASGATQREIAAELLSEEAARVRWRVSMSTVRSQAQRLVRGARMMAAGGYSALLSA